ncbi:MAG: chemotaxis response regulator protein-glutamate methylesterase [Acidobacteria bacterium]|nr:chemotaxis response regulator protein-glutamate methylesterase [Acidobacteriota bacterium]
MPKIRVLAVDDAVVVRRLLTDALSAEADIEVVGVAANGRIALQKIPQCNPDIITMDVEMPDLDGIATVREVRRQWPTLPVVMFSTLTERGAAATMDALSAGASDYVTKPANVGSVTAALDRIRQDLVPKLRALTARRRHPQTAKLPSPSPARSAGAPAPAAVFARSATAGGPAVLCIGTSTGGPNALAAMLPALPKGLGVPIVIVQHMPPFFTKLLADRLDQQCGFPVHEATAGQEVLPDHCYIAPGDFHMEVRRQGTGVTLALTQAPPENSCRPSVDVLFRSVAQVYGARVLGVVLTGMGQDGLAGSRHITEAGGSVIAQDEATSVVWGMPGFVVQNGLASAVLPLESLAAEITARLGHRRVQVSMAPAMNGRPHVAVDR